MIHIVIVHIAAIDLRALEPLPALLGQSPFIKGDVMRLRKPIGLVRLGRHPNWSNATMIAVLVARRVSWPIPVLV